MRFSSSVFSVFITPNQIVLSLCYMMRELIGQKWYPCGSWPWWWFKLVKNSFWPLTCWCPTIWVVVVLLLFFIIIIMSSLSFPAFYLALVPHQKESTATSPKKHISESKKKAKNWWVSKRKTCNLQSQNFYFLSTAPRHFQVHFCWHFLFGKTLESLSLLMKKCFLSKLFLLIIGLVWWLNETNKLFSFSLFNHCKKNGMRKNKH